MTGPRSEPPMPILMTLRIRLPVWPFHSPLRTRLEKPAILASTARTCGTTSLPCARQLGLEITVIAIQEEASKEVESLASRCHWISLGQLGKMIDICRQDGITEVMMCGQVKHAKIFSSIAADWRLLKLLATLPAKNTDGLIGGVIKILAGEGIHLRDSTMLLKPLLAA